MPKQVITEINYLTKIKKRQIRQQIPSLALLALSFLIGFIIPSFGHYPALVFAMIAIAWYLYIGACHRFKERITVPDGDLLLSPVTGRVKSLKTSSDISLLKINKSVIDLVEIRCPHASCVWEEDKLRVNYHGQSLIFRFETEHLIRFEEAVMETGNLIGYIVGSGDCYISIPEPLQTKLKPKEICMAGLSVILEN
ncbi:MAG: hypothetical protein PHY48_05730 [Candidatus Cloacimonetes bacterium]|nr:hypothetical protein [Candidatus Cloacimonadota bacterium]